MIIQGSVRQTTSYPDGSNADLMQGKAGEMIVSELHGKYFTQALRGNVFYGTTTNAGVAIPADNATAQTFMLWNPAGSGKLCIPIHLRAGIVTLGTRVVSSLILNFLPNAGSAIGASGAPITAFTATTPLATYIGLGGTAATRFSLSATTIAMTNYFFVGLFHDLAAGGSPPPFVVDFDGTLILAPNTAMALQSADAATGSTYGVTLTWEEVPI